MNIKNLDKNLIKKFSIIFGIIAIIFIIIIILKLILGGRISYTSIENKMIESAKKYYQNNSEKLPSDGTVTIESSKLIEEGYLKDFSKLVKDKNATCNGQVTVTNSNGSYLYSATLNCGEYYQTKKFKDVLLENVVTSGNGLYNYGNYYIYRGENLNNYVSFAGKTWLILRVYNDGTIRMLETTNRENVVWDDRYNSNRESNVGINDFNVSRIKDTLEEIYNNSNEFSETDKSYISNQNLCIGKRSDSNGYGMDESVECSNTLQNQPIGLLQVNEFALASLDQNCKNTTDLECTNYNYLTTLNSYWTLTADADNTYKVYKVSGSPFVSTASSTSKPRIVVQINSNVNYESGDGSNENPYKFK